MLTTGRETNRRWSLSPLPATTSSANGTIKKEDGTGIGDMTTNGDPQLPHPEEPTPRKKTRFFGDITGDLDSGGDIVSSTTWTEEDDTAAEDSTDDESSEDRSRSPGRRISEFVGARDEDEDEYDDDQEQLDMQLGVRKRIPFGREEVESDEEDARHDVGYDDDDAEEGGPGKVEYIQAGPS